MKRMQPQQPYYGAPQAPPPPQQNPYDFIVNPNQSGPKRPGLPGGGSKFGRIAVVAGGAVLLLILLVAVKGLLSTSSIPAKSFTALAAQQQELVHLGSSGMQNAQSGSVKNFALTARLSITTQQADLFTYLSNNGVKLSKKDLAKTLDTQLDAQLTSAASASNFDSTYTSIMKTELTNYQHSLQQTYNQTKGPKGRAMLSNDYDAAQLLLQQLGS